MSRQDGAGWLLAAAVRLLPPGRREWGTAMRAELVGIGSRMQRWRFTLGCVRVIATRPASWRRVGHPLLMIAVLAGALRVTAPVGYAPLRWGVLALVATLVLVSCLGRVRPLGPVSEDGVARAVRAGGYLLVGVFGAEMVVDMARHANPGDQARSGVPIFTVMFAGYLLGLLAITARRSRATRRTLIAGVVAGSAAATVWTVAVVLAPPIPPDATPALMLIALGMGAAAVPAGRRDGAVGGGLAAMCAGTVAALLILNAVIVLSAFGPPRLIPDLAPVALTPAADLAQSRNEIKEPYLWILLFGWLIALAQCVTSLATRRPRPAEANSAVATVR